MNLKNNPTVEELANLIRPLNDIDSYRLVVNRDGEVNFFPIDGNIDAKMGNAKFWYGSFAPDTLGPKTAENLGYVETILSDLKADWAKGAEGRIHFPS